MGYYHIRLIKEAINLCTINQPWGKYKFIRLPMGVCDSQDIFQDKTNKIFHGIRFIRAYINGLLIITKGD